MPSLTQSEATQLFREPPERHIDVGAGEVALRTVGSGPDVLFVHGWPVSGATYRRMLPHLVGHVTCHVIDLPSSGSSRFDSETPISIDQHIATVRRVVDALGLDEIALVGHDSGGLLCRHAMVGDPRLRAMGLINTEQPNPSFRFRALLWNRHLPGYGAIVGWLAGRRRLRRNGQAMGDLFVDKSLLEGEFEEFALRPLHEDATTRAALMKALDSLTMEHVTDLEGIHRRLDVPVELVWGAEDPFFPVDRTRQMMESLPDAHLTVIPGASLFSQEEAPEAVSRALLPVLTGG